MPRTASTEPIVLIIEDVASEALTLELMCRQFGFRAICVSSPGAASAVLDTLEPNGIITDLLMPGSDGLDGLFMLAARVPEVPVMITTAADRLLLKAAAELGENYGLKNLVCVAKPIGSGALGAFLKRLRRPATITLAEAG